MVLGALVAGASMPRGGGRQGGVRGWHVARARPGRRKILAGQGLMPPRGVCQLAWFKTACGRVTLYVAKPGLTPAANYCQQSGYAGEWPPPLRAKVLPCFEPCLPAGTPAGTMAQPGA